MVQMMCENAILFTVSDTVRGRSRDLTEEVWFGCVHVLSIVYLTVVLSLIPQEREKRQKEREETLIKKDKDKEMDVIKVRRGECGLN